MKEVNEKMGRQLTQANHRIFGVWVLGPATAAVLIVVGSLSAWWMAARTDREMRTDLLQQTQLVAKAVNIERVHALSGTDADLANPDYQRLKEQLTAVRSADPQCRFFYLMGRRSDGMVFLFVDSEPTESEDYSPPGDPYEEADAGERGVFDSRTAAVVGPFVNRWGTWVSALVPITSPVTGKLVAVLGADIDARVWKWEVAARAAMPVGLILMLFIAVAATLAATSAHSRVQAQRKELWENEQWLSATLRSIGDGVIACDVEGNIVDLNTVAETLTGWSIDEARGRPIAEVFRIIHAETRQDADIPVGRAVREGVVVELADHTTLITRDGTERQIVDSCAPIRATAGDVTGAVLVFRDVTEQYRRRQQLRESEEKHRLLIKHAISGIAVHEIVLDAAGKPIDYVFLDANPAFETHTGLRVADILGRRVTEVLPGIDKAPFIETYGTVVLTGESVSFEQFFEPLGRHYAISAYRVAEGRFATVFADISKRKRDEETLRESEENFRVCFESIGDMLAVCAPGGQLLYGNAALQQKLGYTPQELLATHVLDLHPPDVQSEAADIFGAMVRGERSTCPLPWITKSGSLIPVEARVWPGKWNGQDCIFGVAKDLTAEQEAQQRFERLFRNNPALMALSTLPERTFADVNDVFLAKTGYCWDEVIGKTDTELGLFANPEQQAAVADALSTNERTPEYELQVRCKDGSILDGLFSVEVIGSQGRKYFLTVMTDITERKQAAARLAEQTRLLQTVLDGIPDVIALQDVDHSILSYNKAGYELVGLEPEQVHGRKCYELLGRKSPCAACATSAAIAAKQAVSRERFVPEMQRWIRATSIPIIDESGRTTMVVEQLQDITKQEQARRELKDTVEALESANKALEEFNQIAESATRAKSEFLANMSHEIRTPMTAILGYADLLLNEQELEKAPPNQRQNLETIKRNGEHLLGLINDILDLSKVEAGKMEIEPTRCSPFELLAEVVSLMRVRAEAKHLKLELDLAGPLPETVLADPLRLRQVLVNLVGNAIKFTDQGEVRIAARLTDDSGHPCLHFDVTDTGIGMNEKQAGKLFQPFTQVDNSSARKFGGTGLGLCISKRLAEALGGDIKVRSEPGKGSTFSMTIDPGSLDGIRMIQNAQEALLVRPPSAIAETQGKIELHGRVLLAEDGPDNQRLISFLLKKAGADVMLAENGQVAYDEALAACEAGQPFDVILMDMQMPVMDGYTATRQLREKRYTGPIVALTAHAMAGDRQKCLDAGCDDFATKPIDRRKLLATVAHWIVRGPTNDNAPKPTTAVENNASTPMSTAFVYSSLGADPDLGELVDLFVQEMPDRIHSLEAQANSRDWQQLTRTAHQLKGAAGSYGFTEITPYAARLEAAAREAVQEEEILLSLDELLGLCRRVQAGVPQSDEGSHAPQDTRGPCDGTK